MTPEEKEQLRKEWDEKILDIRYSHDHRFNFWVSKLESKDNEISELKDQFTTAVESGLKQQEEIARLTEQLKAAEEVIKGILSGTGDHKIS